MTDPEDPNDLSIDRLCVRATAGAERRRLVAVVRCCECSHGEPDEMGDGTPGVSCDIWFYRDSPSGQRSKVWPINAPDHYCAKGKMRS
jgi:hypothetical protein